MRWSKRWRQQKALLLALQRVRYSCTPSTLTKSLFLYNQINWEAIGLPRGAVSRLISFSRKSKFGKIKYLLGPDDLAWFKQNDPYGNHAALIKEADEIRAHRIRINGVERVDLGKTIDWAKDPITGTRFPSTLFSIRPDPAVDGRIRTELNLHRHLPVLAIAWLLTSRACYADELIYQVSDWLRANPPLDDTFISDGLENASRLFSWTHCLYLLADAPVKENVYLQILSRIQVATAGIEKNYNAAGVPNNHQIAEAFAMFFVGLLYPELKQSRHWLAKGLTLLEENLEAQFLPGGVHAEQSTNYHLFVTEIYFITLLLCAKNGIQLTERFKQRVQEAAEYISYLAKPDLSLPKIGDTGMKFFCPTGDPLFSPSTFIALGGFLFGDGGMKAAAGSWPHEAFWIAGQPKEDSEAHRAASPSVPSRKVWKEAGHIVIRSDLSLEALYFHFDFGPQGLPPRASHGHDDALSVELHALGETFICDPGTYTYVRSHPLREYFSGARGHNTILVDGKGPARLSQGPFGWSKTVNAELRDYRERGDLTWFSATHGAFSDANGAMEVDRSVLVVGDQYVVVFDRVCGEGRHRIESLWHFEPGIKAEMNGNGLRCRGTRAFLFLQTISSAGPNYSLHTGEDPVQPGWYSPNYGIVMKAPVFRSCAEAVLPYRQATALFPSDIKASSPAVLRQTVAVDGEKKERPDVTALEIDRPESGYTDIIVAGDGAGTFSIEGIHTDAQMLFLRTRGHRREAWVVSAQNWHADDGLIPIQMGLGSH